MHSEVPSSPATGAQELDFFKEHEDFEITKEQTLSQSTQPITISRAVNNGGNDEGKPGLL